MLKAFLTCFTLSPQGLNVLGFYDAQAPVTQEFFFYTTACIPHRGVVPELRPKTWLHSHNRLCSCALKHAKSLSSTHIAAIFTQPPPWRPTMKLSARGMHSKHGEYLFLYVGLMLSPFGYFKCTDFEKCVRDL